MSDRLFAPDVLNAYATRDISGVAGMLQSGAVSVILSLIELQDTFEVSGNIAEIGVFQGKTFILLGMALRHGERATAIEIFGNPPGSDGETRAAFEANLARFGLAAVSEVVVADSRAFAPAELVKRLGGANIRLFSVDGDHSKAAVLHDLTLAQAALAPDGVIIADDLFNPWYPSVTEALYEFFRSPDDLEPVALVAANGPVETGAGKLVIARRGAAARYKAGLKLLNQPDLKHCDPFAGFGDVPCFYFSGTPSRYPVDDTIRSILADIGGVERREVTLNSK